jgi:hypothetical protein
MGSDATCNLPISTGRNGREKGLTLKMRPLLVGEPRESPPRKWTHHSSTSTAAEAASMRATFAGAGTAISSSSAGRGIVGARKPARPGRLGNVNRLETVNTVSLSVGRGEDDDVDPANETMGPGLRTTTFTLGLGLKWA